MILVPFFASSTVYGFTKNLLSLPFQAPVFFGCGHFELYYSMLKYFFFLKVPKIIYVNGCLDKLNSVIKGNVAMLGGAGVGIALVQVWKIVVFIQTEADLLSFQIQFFLRFYELYWH